MRITNRGDATYFLGAQLGMCSPLDVVEPPSNTTHLCDSEASGIAPFAPSCSCPVVVAAHGPDNDLLPSETVPLPHALNKIRHLFLSSPNVKVTICKNCSAAKLVEGYTSSSLPLRSITWSFVNFSSLDEFVKTLNFWTLCSLTGMHHLRMKSIRWECNTSEGNKPSITPLPKFAELRELLVLSNNKSVSTEASTNIYFMMES